MSTKATIFRRNIPNNFTQQQTDDTKFYNELGTLMAIFWVRQQVMAEVVVELVVIKTAAARQ